MPHTEGSFHTGWGRHKPSLYSTALSSRWNTSSRSIAFPCICLAWLFRCLLSIFCHRYRRAFILKSCKFSLASVFKYIQTRRGAVNTQNFQLWLTTGFASSPFPLTLLLKDFLRKLRHPVICNYFWMCLCTALYEEEHGCCLEQSKPGFGRASENFQVCSCFADFFFFWLL